MDEKTQSNQAVGSKILLVDDVPQNIQLLGTILAPQGYALHFATNGLEALEAHNENDFDLILLDIMMPKMDGLEACQRIRSGTHNARVPIIFLTAKAEKENIVEGLNAGGSDYVTKPFNDSELLARVETQLRIRRQEKDLHGLVGAKDKFISLVSHDLRGPFSGIVRMLELLIQQWDDIEDDQKKNYLLSLLKSGQSTYELLENLLSLSLFDQDQGASFHPVLVEPLELFDEIKNLLDFLFQQKGLSLYISAQEMLHLWCDVQMLRTVLRNLISNSLKFTPQGGAVHLEAYPGDGGGIQIHVSDNGVGIPEDKIPYLFDPTKRYTTLGTNREKGSGFGLGLVKRLVNTHGGTIEVKSTQGEGTRFILSFPGPPEEITREL